MGFKTNIMALMVGIICATSTHAQTTATNTTKATAQLAATCVIAAQNVSFGSLMLPISSQTANSTLKVTCTKSSSYIVSMNPTNNVWLVNANGTSTWYGYNTVTNTRIDLPTAGCGTQSGGQCATSGGYVNSGAANGTTQLCSYPWGCTVYKSGNSSSGSMIGAVKGDTVAYSIMHPTSGTAWTATNTYASTGTGSNQDITVQAKLLPGQSTAYPTPDNYSDTVTTQISF